MKRSFLYMCVACAMLLAGAVMHSSAPEPTAKPPEETMPREQGITAWAAYWDADAAVEELTGYREKLSALVYFAAYFNEKNELFVPKQIGGLIGHMAAASAPLPEEYLSFTNDRLAANGDSILKDTEILRPILTDPGKRQEHIEQIIATALSVGLSAVEIDYEGFSRNPSLLAFFPAFVQELHKRTSALGMPLRVLLEPSWPMESLVFPTGPEYVMMCYNLHGPHSGPGPKADPAFLRKLVARMEALPGKKSFAIATGGFDWAQDAQAASLTYKKALELQQRYGVQARRDAESGCLVFQYQDDQGKAHEVWYADGQTLRLWTDAIQSMGPYDVNLWRLGGNDPASFGRQKNEAE